MGPAPLLYDYVLATSYLRELYAYRKNENLGFSYEAWASELGFKSRSYITMILNKERNITQSFIETFSSSMGFNEEQKSFFTLIVDLEQCKSEGDRQFCLDRIFQMKGQNKELIEINRSEEFLTSEILPQLLVLISFKDIDRSSIGLSRFLKKDFASIQRSLEKLQNMNLAVNQNQTWVPTKKSFKVPKDLGSLPLRQYHDRCLQKAIQAQDISAELRRFRSVLLPLSEDDYQNLLQDIEGLISKAVAKYDSDTLEGKRLYMMNVNAFPVTEKAHKLENETRLFEIENVPDTETTI